MGAPLLPRQLGASSEMAVEVAFGANLAADPGTWTYSEITDDVLQNPGVRITVGRGDELSQASPATCTFRVKNTLGQYTPFNPQGSNYPNVLLGVPVRVLVTLNGVDIFTRFQGQIVSWEPGWDAQGKFAYLTVTAAGDTRRLGSGSKPLRSALERAIVAEAPLEYWPCEDGSSSTEIASGLPGHPATKINGLTFASDTGLVGSAPLLAFESGGSIVGPVTATPSASQWQWDWHYNMPGDPGADTVVMQINTTGTITIWQYVVLNGGTTYSIRGYDNTGALAINRSFATLTSDPVSGAWSHWSFYVQDGGSGTVNYAFHYYPSLGGIGLADGGSFSGTPGHPVSWGVPPSTGIAGTALGHVVLYDAYNYTQPGLPAFGYVGETAEDRLTRLCAEEGVTLTVTGNSNIAMGPQHADTFMNLVRECETADVGVLLDGLAVGLTYACRNALYSQAAALTIDANSGQVPADATPAPVFDDQKITNSVTVANRTGSSVTVEDTDGTLGTAAIGVFDSEYGVNLSADTDLVSFGSWIVHIRTAEGMRYPQVLVDFAAAPELATDWLNVTPTNRLDITNLVDQLTQHPPQDVSLLVEGWTETLNSRTWRVAVNTSPYRVWEVFKIGDSRLGRIQTDGSTVHQNYSTGATSIKIDSSGGLWTTGAVSFDVEIRGWQISVTNISGASSPQTFTVTALPGDIGTGNPVKLWRSGVIAL